jgi:hypothetical protein
MSVRLGMDREGGEVWMDCEAGTGVGRGVLREEGKERARRMGVVRIVCFVVAYEVLDLVGTG